MGTFVGGKAWSWLRRLLVFPFLHPPLPTAGMGLCPDPPQQPTPASRQLLPGHIQRGCSETPQSSVVLCSWPEQPALLDLTLVSLWVTGLAVCLHMAGSTVQRW